MLKIEIDKIRDTIIVEKSNGNNILKGSNLYCGCCGNTFGQLKKDLTFPFESQELKKSLENCTMRTGIGGSVRHDKCRHSMFTFNNVWGFITLENYNKQIHVDTI